MQAAGDGTLDFAAPDNGPETLTVNGLRSALAIAIQGLRKLSTFYPLTGESRSLAMSAISFLFICFGILETRQTGWFPLSMGKVYWLNVYRLLYAGDTRSFDAERGCRGVG